MISNEQRFELVDALKNDLDFKSEDFISKRSFIATDGGLCIHFESDGSQFTCIMRGDGLPILIAEGFLEVESVGQPIQYTADAKMKGYVKTKEGMYSYTVSDAFPRPVWQKLTLAEEN